MGKVLRLTAETFAKVPRHHLDPRVRHERLSFLFARSTALAPGDVLISGRPLLLGDDCFSGQSGGHLTLHPQVLDAVLARFATTECDTLINVHDHWFSAFGTDFSSIDTRDDLAFARYLRLRYEPMLAREAAYQAREVVSVSWVLDQSGLAARYVDRTGRLRPIERVEVVGPRAKRVIPYNTAVADAEVDPSLARQDFISPESQALIAGTTIAIAGCGGLGSIAAESLYRLGFRQFLLVDPDTLEPHNLNRWQGGRPGDVGTNKAELLARRLRRLSGGAVKVLPIAESLFSPVAQFGLQRADLIVGCVDNHLARFLLNRFAIQYLRPYFDAAVRIVAGDATNFEARTVAVIPGATACLECTAYELLDLDEIAAALCDDVTLAERRAAGYVEARPEIAAPSAYSLNLRAVSTLTTEVMNWACGFRPLATCTVETWREGRFQRSDRDNHPEGPSPSCPACGQLLAAGDGASLPSAPATGHVARILAEARDNRLAPEACHLMAKIDRGQDG